MPYVACLLAFFLLLQGAGFAGGSPTTVLVSIGVYFASTVLVQRGPVLARLLNAAAPTAMLTLIGYGLGLAV